LNCMSLLLALMRKIRPLNRHGRRARKFVSGLDKGDSLAQFAWVHSRSMEYPHRWNNSVDHLTAAPKS
jgi:hypothetical protein